MRVSRCSARTRPSPLTAPISSLVGTLVVALVAVLLPGGGRDVAHAQSSTELREQQEQVEDQLEGARDAEAGIAEELEGAEEVRQEVEGELADATARVDEVLIDIERVEDEQAGLQREVADLSVEAAETRASLSTQIRTLYMQGAAESFIVALDAQAAQEVGVRSHYLEALSRGDRARLEVLGNVTTQLEAREEDLLRVTDELDALRADAEEAQSALDRELFIAAGYESEVAQQLADAEGEARRLANEATQLAAAAAAAEQAEEEERQRAIAAAEEAERRAQAAAAASAAAAAEAAQNVSSGGSSGDSSSGDSSSGGPSSGGSAPVSSDGKSCPQDNPRSFTDTWGAPRSGGRSHQGTDIFGTRGGNVFAIVDGTVAFTRSGGISGLFLGLQGDDGNLYYYIHLQDFVASAGQRVSAGQLIGHNGDTGNARGTTPHIHFELHPGGGAAVNPYPLLRAVCG